MEKIFERIYNNSRFYRYKFNKHSVRWNKISSIKDLKYLPFTTKEELRDIYPLGLQAVDDEEIVRIHSSSGTTGKPVIIPYTKTDVNNWAEMMKRCFEVAGITKRDRIHITPGYGLWTAGIGFQAGAEKLGAMAVPMGPGNTEKQLQMMVDLQTTVLIGTSSYGLVIAEEIEKRGLKDKICLTKGIFGSERWGEKMRSRISQELEIEIYDIYGLTEIFGPGIAIDCQYHEGMHYWNDHCIFEIIDPVTCEPLPEGEVGELVITTITKQGAPLVRYRTRDLTRIIPGRCKCGLDYPRIDRIIGRTDDMIKVKGVNIYPGQIDEVLGKVDGVSSEYQIIIEHKDGRDEMLLKVEIEVQEKLEVLQKEVEHRFKSTIGIQILVEGVSVGSLPRSNKKTKRVFDYREQ